MALAAPPGTGLGYRPSGGATTVIIRKVLARLRRYFNVTAGCGDPACPNRKPGQTVCDDCFNAWSVR
ncbi:hypothetical protein EV667_2183 [Ancylobacter aquaticus]|uniref:Uncharacterized protein n=1 Tax=Ancylobacter aquaticus TaxID=100 RepID=A0A4R1I3I4_ANCAQ|nr:hypothetical protein EV667_2183 [Ancylobacter aquaticus]